jgi:hypothetical protein
VVVEEPAQVEELAELAICDSEAMVAQEEQWTFASFVAHPSG